ncbi:protein mel-28-like [Patiria miniata]|uniref:Uncharacterized protein n=1 Tax=Patiria miniata TaxID=46514 RepID=A0A913ZH80_PATMI|nr:protein mel-28-like [Patiria miniata]
MARYGPVFRLIALTSFALCSAGVVLRKELAANKGLIIDRSIRDLKDTETGGTFLSRFSDQTFQLDPPKNQGGLGAWPNTDDEGVDTVKNTGENYSTGLAAQYRDKRGAWSWLKKTPVKKKGATKGRNKWRGQPRGRPRPQDEGEDDDDDDCSDSSSSSSEEDDVSIKRKSRKPWEIKRRGRGNSFNRDDEGDDERRRKGRPSKRCRKKNRGKGRPPVTTAMPTTTTERTTTERTTTVTVTTPQPPTTTQVSETTAVVKTTQILTRSVSQSSAPKTEKQISTMEPTTVYVMSSTEEPSTTVERTTTSAFKTLGIDPEPK